LFHEVHNVLLAFKPLFDGISFGVEPLELVGVQVRLFALIFTSFALIIHAFTFVG
jgi:hypothetical protein